MVGVSSGIATKTVEKKGASGQIEETTLSIAVPAFFMARWPVTVAQFRAFADARSGLSLNPKSLAAPPNLPVVHVTWQDATAYCSWLTEVLAESDETPEPLASLLRREEWRESAWEVTLPSQVEWEAAARAWSESVFPWGDQIDPTRANYNDTGVGRRSAVGCFPSGANALGIEELSGNVLEWTRSVEDDDDNEVIDGTATDPRVCVGGAFFSTSENVRCGYAFRTDPDEDSDYLGFRVVVRPRLKRKAPKDNSAPLPPRLEPGLQD
jgi:formylglycine-generating enzyme required for sulfatase activity